MNSCLTMSTRNSLGIEADMRIVAFLLDVSSIGSLVVLSQGRSLEQNW